MKDRKVSSCVVFICIFVLVLCGEAAATLIEFSGIAVDVEGWVGAAPGEGVSQTIVVIDWNGVNGPYATPSHAWGYRWLDSETRYVADALAAIDDAYENFTMTTGYGGGFIDDIFFDDGTDYHDTTGRSGWWWVGQSTDGVTWTANSAGITEVTVSNGQLQGLNIDVEGWGGDPTVPVPEPATILLLAIGGAMLRSRSKKNEH